MSRNTISRKSLSRKALSRKNRAKILRQPNKSKTIQSAPHPSKPVENSTTSCGKLVENQPKSVDKATITCGEPVNNSQKTAKNSPQNVEKPAASCAKPANNPTTQPEKTGVEENRTCTACTSSTPAAAQATAKPVIKVTNLAKSFKLPTERAAGLKQAIFNWLKGVKGFTRQEVLRGINFEVREGEFLGIVGRNGSGKSTLLKLLANIYYPEQGTIEVNGTLVPFIELGVGFNPELTGRENVYLNGALLGFSSKEMDAMYDEIVQFAELEPFMDAKLKNYSSGMQVRLAFSIAIRAKGDILVLDEVLAVGDAAFQEKCNNYFSSLHGNQTVILVTHDMGSVRRFCDRAILIENGEIAADGRPDDIAVAYENLWK